MLSITKKTFLLSLIITFFFSANHFAQNKEDHFRVPGNLHNIIREIIPGAQWQFDPTFNNTFNAIQALKMHNTSTSTVYVIDRGFKYKNPALDYSRIKKILSLSVDENGVISHTDINLHNLKYPPNGFVFSHGDIVSTVGFASTSLNSGEYIPGIVPNTRLIVCRIQKPKSPNDPLWVKQNAYCLNEAINLSAEFDIVLMFGNNEGTISDIAGYEHQIIPPVTELLNRNKIIFAATNNNKVCTSDSFITSYFGNSPLVFVSNNIRKNGTLGVLHALDPYMTFSTPGSQIVSPHTFYTKPDDNPMVLGNIEPNAVNGGCINTSIAAAGTSLVVSVLKKHAQDAYNPKWVKPIIQTTSEKSGITDANYTEPNIKTILGGVGDSNQETVLLYDEDANEISHTYGAGRFNLHQAILMASAMFGNSARIHVPDKSPLPEPFHKTMPANKMMFNEDITHGFALNRHKMTGYKLPDLPETGKVIYESASTTPYVLGIPEENQWKKFANSLEFKDEDLFLKSIDGGDIWRASIPFDGSIIRNRKLIETKDFICDGDDDNSLCHRRLPELGECNNFSRQFMILQKISLDKFSSRVFTKKDFKYQYFELANQAATCDQEGLYEKGDVLAKRVLKENSKAVTVWSNRNGNMIADLRRKLLSDYTYSEENEINNNDIFTDNEYILSPDGRRNLLITSEGISILQKNDQGTSEISDDTWQKFKLLASNKGLDKYSAHRLEINEGLLRFIGGTENEDGEFTQEAVLRTFNQVCFDESKTSNSNLNFNWSADGRMLIFTNEDGSPHFLINIDAEKTSILTTNQKLIYYNRDRQNPNEVKFLFSEDESKMSIIDGQTLKVLENHDGVFCANKPLSSIELGSRVNKLD